LPRVVPSGTVVGTLLPEIAESTGLPSDLVVTTGMTDGCASQVASGAVSPGTWNTTIGTTMVIKGVTEGRIEDPLARVYSHRHPDGYWMPGGASNTGADWISRDYAGHDLHKLERKAAAFVPTGAIAYPLRQNGERFPFLSSSARGFDPPGMDGVELYAARLEGVAYLERLSYDLLERLSGEPVTAVYTAGGGSRSKLWLQIRASVLGVPVHRTRYGEGAAGAAIVAARGTRYASLGEASAALNPVIETVEPNDWRDAHREGYRRFRAALHERGYVASEEIK
jgi:sugar (pentulose or hexulose) kinase